MKAILIALLVTAALPLAMPTADAYACFLPLDDPAEYVECEVNRAESCVQNTLEKRPWCPA